MPKDSNIDLVSIIKEVFDPVFNEYDFQLQNGAKWDGQGENVLKATGNNMELTFFLSEVPLFYYCSVGIKLLAELAERATPHTYFRDMSVDAIATGLDPNFKPSRRGAQTTGEVKALFEAQRDVLLKYCSDILKGDVSSWTGVAAQMAEEWEKRKAQR